MDIAVIGTLKKENEHRVPIHPNHIQEIPFNIRQHLFFEKGYGIPFGMDDAQIVALTGNELLERQELFAKFKGIVITKPIIEDFEEMQEGTLVWGWIHSVQQELIAQIAIDKKLTLIAWENMNYESSRELLHIFNKNNEMAGYCGVQHALQLKGIDGLFGAKRKVVVISHGSVSRGALFALQGHNFTDITVYTQRPTYLVANKIPGVDYKQIVNGSIAGLKTVKLASNNKAFLEELLCADIIVNGMLQNTNNPVNFIHDGDVEKFKKPCLIIDISCDEGMGFDFAIPTTIKDPILSIGKVAYYGVDHTPTLLWNSASWEISKCVLPYLPHVVDGSYNEVLRNAIDVKDGIIVNEEILSYQNRSIKSPYEIVKVIKVVPPKILVKVDQKNLSKNERTSNISHQLK